MTDKLKTSGADRRGSERLSARIEVHFKEARTAAKALRAYSLNFSTGGLCLKTSRQYSVGTELQLHLSIEQAIFDLVGVVAWVRGGAVGVRFVEIGDRDRAVLEQLIRTFSAS